MMPHPVICIYLVITRIPFKRTTLLSFNGTTDNLFASSSTITLSNVAGTTLTKFGLRPFQLNWTWQMIVKLALNGLFIMTLFANRLGRQKKKTTSKQYPQLAF
eukprot:NODE_423_length_7705_cov_0.829871.p8 type:complete len:103 gc:universal NODE_423_length_7705_cov_0.829871:3050-2742(-)